MTFVTMVQKVNTYEMRKNQEITKELLEFLLLTGGVSLILINPAFLVPAILIARYSNSHIDKRKLKNSISYLKNKKYISTRKTDKGVRVELTKTGKEKATHYRLQSTLLDKLKQRNKVWDKKWRIVIFDIKSDRREKRDALRRMLKRSGFEQLQKSAWIFPFDCRQEVSLIKDYFDIKDIECRLVVASDIGDDITFKKKFKIS